jgi:acyl-CoA thioester hydrolase
MEDLWPPGYTLGQTRGHFMIFDRECQVNKEVETQPWGGLSGRLSGAGHVLAVRVYFEDTDFSGLVYHTSYLRWCERGRSDYLRLLGVRHEQLAAGAFAGEPCAFAVRRITADYLKPARIDEILEVHTATGAVTKASLVLKQQIARDGIPIFRLEAQCVLLSMSGRLLRIPSVITNLFLGCSDAGS